MDLERIDPDRVLLAGYAGRDSPEADAGAIVPERGREVPPHPEGKREIVHRATENIFQNVFRRQDFIIPGVPREQGQHRMGVRVAADRVTFGRQFAQFAAAQCPAIAEIADPVEEIGNHMGRRHVAEHSRIDVEGRSRATGLQRAKGLVPTLEIVVEGHEQQFLFGGRGHEIPR